jgi:hypothetical protein
MSLDDKLWRAVSAAIMVSIGDDKKRKGNDPLKPLRGSNH